MRGDVGPTSLFNEFTDDMRPYVSHWQLIPISIHCCIAKRKLFVVRFIIMDALCSRCGHYIFVLRVLLLSSFLSRLISAVADWISTMLPRMMWP